MIRKCFPVFPALLLLLYGCHPGKKAFTFYVFSDTHCLDSLNRRAVLDSMIAETNTLHQKALPDSLQHLRNSPSKGLLICGDLTDDARPEQWQQFTALFGLNGDSRLQLPVYENYGNHDGDTTGIVRTAIRERNKKRKGLRNVSPNGLHYSWDWGKYHFVSLGSYPSDNWDSTCEWCHYFKRSFREPQQSLSFLKSDLEKHGAGKKVILYFHYGWDSFSKLWWTEAEQEKFYEVIRPYNVAAIFTGHNHATGYLNWKGIDVYSAGSPQSGNKTGSFLVVHAGSDSLHVVERRFNRWGTHSYKKAVGAEKK